MLPQSVVAAAPPVTVPPTVLHAFQSVALPGCDPTLNYKAVDKNALLVKAWPSIEWVDASTVGANCQSGCSSVVSYHSFNTALCYYIHGNL